MLTARSEAADRVRGLEVGVDDYLAKPFEPSELLLRIGSVLRRTRAPSLSNRTARCVRFGPFAFSLERGELRNGADIVRLTEREREILRLLCAKAGASVSREALSGPGAAAQERTVDVQINRLRRKIEVDPANPLYPPDGARLRLPLGRRPMSALASRPALRALARLRAIWRRGGARARRHAAEGALCALPAHRHRADGAAADRGRLRLHAAPLGPGHPSLVGGGRARRRRHGRSLCAIPPGGDDKRLRVIAAERFRMDVELMPAGPLPPQMPKTFFSSLDPLTRALPEELAAQVRLPSGSTPSVGPG